MESYPPRLVENPETRSLPGNGAPNQDGQPRRRGPKPDTKPAKTRRQELNRQAQRTHRERKEQYIRTLEIEISRLREGYTSDITKANLSIMEYRKALEAQQEENRILREVLASHGIDIETELERRKVTTSTPQSSLYAERTSQSAASGSQAVYGMGSSNYLTPDTALSSSHSPTALVHEFPGGAMTEHGVSMQMNPYPGAQMYPYQPSAVDIETGIMNARDSRDDPDIERNGIFEKDPQLGIDFILSLEMPCRGHLERLCRRASDDDSNETIAGHILMAMCPPPSAVETTERGGLYPAQTYDLPHANLNTLFSLSKQLVGQDEITPIMALQYLRNHEMYPSITREDVMAMMSDLVAKIRCYGFGAILENFEFMDSLNSVLARKSERPDEQLKANDMASLSIADLVSALPSEDTWGPPVPTGSTLNGVPYAPFSKGDKLGRMADWSSEGKDGRERGGRQAYNRNYRDQQVYGAGTSNLFAVQAAEDESTFSVVDNTRTSTKTRGFGRGGGMIFRGRGQRGALQRGGQRGGRGGFQRVGGGRGGQAGGYYDNRGGRGGRGGGRRFGWRDYDKPQRNRDSSIAIRPEWNMLEEVDFGRLAKLNLEAPEAEDLDDYGFLYYYDRSYDKPPVKGMERKLQHPERAAYNVTTSADPVIQELAEKNEATVFATADILSMLMCAPRSVYSWDIVIVQHGDKIYIDKRDNASIDLVTVNENANDAPIEVSEAQSGTKHDPINTPGALALEATIINHNFALQTVVESESSKLEFPHSNPFYSPSEDTEPLASKAFKYRRFDLSVAGDEEPLTMIVRTESDAVMKNTAGGEDQFVTLRALNEFDHKAPGAGGALDWRTKLASQRGAVVATEMKNNNCKLARWTTQALLGKTDVLKLGFVARANPRSATSHIVLGVMGYKPREFALQMNLNVGNGWGIVRTIVDLIRSLDRKASEEDEEDAGDDRIRKYILVKDPNKSVLRLYGVPANTFEEDEDTLDRPSKEDGKEEDEDSE
ncbi:hypothetical protein FQN57_004810 [Myotisia sp. PD_48]|nr:hypothetical protein FQN57_004810 [Myotisia sp. PD_48]